MALQYSIPTPKSNFTDPRTGLISKEWFYYLNNIFGTISSLSGGSVTASTGALTTNALTIADGPSDIRSLTGLTVSSVAVATSTGAIGTPAGLGTATTVLHGNVAGFPSYSAVSLTADVSGILPEVSGGTGVSSYSAASSVIVNNGASFSSLAAGVSTQVLHGNATTFPFYSAVSLTADVSGVLPLTNGGTGTSSYSAVSTVILNSGAGSFSSLAAGTSTQVLHGNATTFPFYSAVSLTADVSGVLPIANGGTNASTALNNGRLMISSSGAIVEATSLTNGQFFIGSTGAGPVASTLTAGANITITNAAGSITVAATGSAGALTLISTSSAASTATIDFTGLSSTYNEYLVTFTDIVPTTNNVSLLSRISEDNGATFKSGAGNYQWIFNYLFPSTNSVSASSSDTAVHLTSNMGNGTGQSFSGEMRFYGASGAVVYKKMAWQLGGIDNAPEIAYLTGAGAYTADASSTNALRFLPSSGFFSTGTFSLYGLAK